MTLPPPPPPPPPPPSSPSPSSRSSSTSPSPGADYDGVRTPERPTSIRVAVWSFRAAAVWTVGSSLLFWWWVRSSIHEIDQAASTTRGASEVAADLGLEGEPARWVEQVLETVADDRWRGWLTAIAVATIAGAVVVAVVYLALARAIARGSTVARGLATAFAVVSLVWLVLGPQAWVWVALGVAGVVAAWRPSSSAYLAAVRAGRR